MEYAPKRRVNIYLSIWPIILWAGISVLEWGWLFSYLTISSCLILGVGQIIKTWLFLVVMTSLKVKP